MGRRILLASILVLVLLASTHLAWSSTNRNHSTPAVDRYYGTFGFETQSVAVLSAETQASLPDALDAFYAHSVNPGQVVVMWLGGSAPSGMLLKNHEKVVLVDPANVITGSAVQRLQQLNALFITHEHYDHFSEPAAVAIQSKTGAVVVVNPGCYSALSGSIPSDKLVRMRSGDTLVVSGIGVAAVASIHPGNEPLTYVLTFSDFSAFHGSDSGFNPALSGFKGKAKLAMVPTGGGSPTASPDEALEMVEALEPTDVIPMHGTTDSNNRLGALLAKEIPDVQYVRPQASSSVVVNELAQFGFVTALVSLLCIFHAVGLTNRDLLGARKSPDSGTG